METCRPRAFENSCSVGFFYSVLLLVTLCFVKSTKQGQQTGSRFHLWEVIRPDFYDNISHSEVEIINTKALNKSMQSKDDESGFIICADLDKLRSFGQTPTSLKTNTEELLDSSLTIIPIIPTILRLVVHLSWWKFLLYEKYINIPRSVHQLLSATR